MTYRFRHAIVTKDHYIYSLDHYKLYYDVKTVAV